MTVLHNLHTSRRVTGRAAAQPRLNICMTGNGPDGQEEINIIRDVSSTPSRKAFQLSTIPDPANLPITATLRRRKTQSTPHRLPGRPWPRMGKRVPIEDIVDVTQKIFEYEPRNWQLDIFKKCAEGFDTFGSRNGLWKVLGICVVGDSS